MTTMPAAADVNLDELKKKARRRLVGACVLALAAAVFVPMLLESDERPLGDDISVKIPPVDPGKFVNRLNSSPASGKNAPKDSQAKPGSAAVKGSDAPADARTSSNGDASGSPAAATAGSAAAANADKAGATSKSLGDAERRVLGSTSSGAVSAAAPQSNSTSASAPASSSPPVSSSVSSPAPETASVPVSTSAAEAKPTGGTPDEPKSAASAADAKKTTAAPAADARKSAAASPADAKKSPVSTSTDAKKTASAASRSTHGEFVVQLAAFSDDKGANALANRLKRSGHPAFTEPVNTSRGTLWRVRVGPYASRDEANAARDKLKREGQDGIVAARS